MKVKLLKDVIGDNPKNILKKGTIGIVYGRISGRKPPMFMSLFKKNQEWGLKRNWFKPLEKGNLKNLPNIYY